MPLLRRWSSAKAVEGTHPAEHSERRPSLLDRLRRNSDHEADSQRQLTTTSQALDSDHAEVKQPASTSGASSLREDGTQDAPLQSQAASDEASIAGGLSKEDVRALFFGAPHFMLEKGRHGKVFPQTFFPWNSDLEVSDLQDRRHLSHESFALVTLHAHLPIPDEMVWKPSSVPQKKEETWKRPVLDLGIFETPNMLGFVGNEPGTIGFRYFLELPISERLRTSEKAKQEERGLLLGQKIEHLSANDALKAMQHESKKPPVGKRAPRQDRMQLIRDGPQAWKRFGIRDVHPAHITNRLDLLCRLHDHVLAAGLENTILHKQNCASLHQELFGVLLYPPETLSSKDGHDRKQGLKVQIEALVKILTTPGMWIDFSLIEPRVRLGQGLWQLPPHDEKLGSEDTSLVQGAERMWLLLQLLLACELLVRLDAALRLGASKQFEDFHLTGDEIHFFNKLRNLKVDWDLVVARRFLDMMDVRTALPPRIDTSDSSSNLVSAYGQKLTLADHNDKGSIWDCILLPRRANVQIEGLLRFARMIEWDNIEDFETQLMKRLSPSRSPEEVYAVPIAQDAITTTDHLSEADRVQSLFSGDHWIDRAWVILQAANDLQPGGWLSRSWLTGMVSPGEAGCLCMMACLLENDPEAISKLGASACLHGGFSLGRRTWWSKTCIVGRVLAPYTRNTECMGWMNMPLIIPVNHEGEELQNTWLNVAAERLPRVREQLRINDGQKLADESNVLGTGRGKVLSKEFVMITDKILDNLNPTKATVGNLILKRSKHDSEGKTTLAASLTFDICSTGEGSPSSHIIQLAYEVGFVAAHPCRPPHGHAVFGAAKEEHPHHQAHEHLPSHPLHRTYKYVTRSLADLISASPGYAAPADGTVWLVEARGEPDREIFVRAWCSSVGRSALVARQGKTCLSCVIREANALQLSIIIRVGVSTVAA